MAMKICGHQVIDVHTNSVNSCDFYVTTLVTGSSDKTVRIFELNDEDKFEQTGVSPLVGHQFPVLFVQFNSTGDAIGSCCMGGDLFIWDVAFGHLRATLSHPIVSRISTFVFSPKSYYLAASDAEKIIIFSGRSFVPVKSLYAVRSEPMTLTFTYDAKYIVAGFSDGTLGLWDTATVHAGCLAQSQLAHDLGVLSCEIASGKEDVSNSGEYTLATCGYDNRVRIWKVKCQDDYAFSLKYICAGHECNVYSCRFSPDSTVLASTGNDHKVIFWDVKSGRKILSAEAHYRCGIACCAFSNHLYFATGSLDKTVVIWRLSQENSESSASAAAPLPKKKDLYYWSLKDVENWLRDIGLAEYAHKFRSNAIDGKALLFLNHESLEKALGISVFGHRLKILNSLQMYKSSAVSNLDSNLSSAEPCPLAIDFCPKEFECPIRKEIMKDPVVASDGYTYERDAIEKWFNSGKHTSPITNEVLQDQSLIPNLTLNSLINSFLEK